MANLTAVQQLRKAKKLIEAGWCKGTTGVTANGEQVGFASPRARRFCASGAVKQRSIRSCAEKAAEILDSAELNFGFCKRVDPLLAILLAVSLAAAVASLVL